MLFGLYLNYSDQFTVNVFLELCSEERRGRKEFHGNPCYRKYSNVCNADYYHLLSLFYVTALLREAYLRVLSKNVNFIFFTRCNNFP